MRRRELLMSGALALAGCASGPPLPQKTRVLVVGGGYGGATAAKYLRWLSGYTLDVLLVEPEPDFVSCPMSNLVLGGTATLAQISRNRDALERRHGVRLVRDRVARIDTAARRATLASGVVIGYDKMLLSPGVELMNDQVEGLREARAQGRVLQAWSAGAETLALRAELEGMRDGGVYAIAIPEAPYRCPPAPYERACLVASYFKAAKPRSKVLILDANQDVTSKGPLFKKAWSEDYKGIVEYRPEHKAVGVDAANGLIKFEVQDDVKADVMNVLPPMRAGAIAVQSGLATVNARWCDVDYLSFESKVAKDIHIIGDSIQIAPLMPKSGSMANNQAKVAAAAIIAQLAGIAPDPAPMLLNTCYSFVDPKRTVHITSVHEYVAAERTFKPVAGSGGLSHEASEEEGIYAWNWARTIWDDMLG